MLSSILCDLLYSLPCNSLCRQDVTSIVEYVTNSHPVVSCKISMSCRLWQYMASKDCKQIGSFNAVPII